MSANVRRVIIVGGGITGLACARAIAEASTENARFEALLLESSQRFGGNVALDAIASEGCREELVELVHHTGSIAMSSRSAAIRAEIASAGEQSLKVSWSPGAA